MRNDSKCRKNIFCDFTLSRDLPDAQVEVCTKCGKKVVYFKDIRTGRIDNKKYLRDHIRDTVQPFGRTRKLFLMIYGENPIKSMQKSMRERKSKAKMRQEWEDVRRDLHKRMKQIYR